MNNQTNKLIPKLRFPEFVNDGEWEEEIIESIANAESSSVALNKLELKKEGYPVYGADSIVGFIDSYQHEQNYISIVKDGSGVGRLNLAESKSTILGTLTALKSKDAKKYNLHWIYYLLNTIDITSYVKGAGIPHIYYSDYKNEKILIPKRITEQQKIADCLFSLDELITVQNDKLEILKTYKKGLMQNIFPKDGEKAPKLRFKKFEKDGEWDKQALEKISHKIMVGIASAATHAYRKSGIILFRNQNIKEGYLEDKDVIFIDEEYEKEHKNKRLKTGDLLTARTGYPGTTCIVPSKHQGSQSFTTLITRPNNTIIDSTFLCFYINSETGQAFFNSTKIGGGQQNVNAGSLSQMPIIFPSKKEQQKIAETLSSLDELIKEQSNKIEQLKSHKKGLMQGLFPKVRN